MTKVIFVLRDGCGIHEAQLATYKEATGLVNLWAEGGIRTPHLKLINSDTGVTTFAIETAKIVCMYIPVEGA